MVLVDDDSGVVAALAILNRAEGDAGVGGGAFVPFWRR